jgi:hypothetical protein
MHLCCEDFRVMALLTQRSVLAKETNERGPAVVIYIYPEKNQFS